jgi:hypothetical protein
VAAERAHPIDHGSCNIYSAAALTDPQVRFVDGIIT